MTMDDAIVRACASVGIVPPRGRQPLRKWIPVDTLAKNGKGDGRIILDEERVTAVNWQTGDKATVWLKKERTVEDRKRYAQARRAQDAEDRKRAERAANLARQIIAAAKPGQHAYLARKGFRDEQALVISAGDTARIGGDYLVPSGAAEAIVIPARIGKQVTSAQLIWEDGTKKFLYGGEMGGAAHRIASGRDIWLCEGYATALSVRTALRGLNRTDTVLVCFSASNIAKVASALPRPARCLIAADNDAPPAARPEQFDGKGAGEYFAHKAGKPYAMPPDVGTDFNDLHVEQGIFAVQRVLMKLNREAIRA
ncbi:toprim domain-containing protein [Pelagibacterium sediminicola]|uniref:toprim domain-containing protein n=1 Tax=Pelagibacterium sediminicola TaxID=2248761 RepID=UPI001300B3A6|nr:toprim domain-containing protein [Pelagibacterium sediminicola]